MPHAKVHVLEGRYDEARLNSVSAAIHDALISVLNISLAEFSQISHILPRERFLHTPAFLNLKCSDDFLVLELTFISDGLKETRVTLLRELSERIVSRARISPDDLLIELYELPDENISFGQGLAHRAVVPELVSET